MSDDNNLVPPAGHEGPISTTEEILRLLRERPNVLNDEDALDNPELKQLLGSLSKGMEEGIPDGAPGTHPSRPLTLEDLAGGFAPPAPGETPIVESARKAIVTCAKCGSANPELTHFCGTHEMFAAISEAQKPERRIYPRASVLAELRQMTFVELGSTGGLLLDISAGGISVQAAHAIKKGDPLGVKFLLPFSRYLVRATCEVAWSDGGHAGLKFAPLSDVEQRQLGLWLEAYAKGPIPPSAIPVEAPSPDILQEIAKYDESRTPISAASTSGAVEPSLTGRTEPESKLPGQEVIERELSEQDRTPMAEKAPSLAGADGAAIALRDDRDVVCETSPTVEPPRANRRACRRLLTDVPMLARWRDDREHEMKVNSRDISDGGIFFHAHSAIALGTEVEVIFTLPSDPAATGNKRIRVQGTVMRAEREADKSGYALRVTSSELLGEEDTVAPAMQAVRCVAGNDPSSAGPSRARRVRILFLACGLVALVVLAGLVVGIFITRHAGGPANAAAALREIVASIRLTQGNVPPRDVLQRRVEGKGKVLRTGGAGATEKAASSPAKGEAAQRNRNASAAQVPSTADSKAQPQSVPFNNNIVLTLDFQKGRQVSPLGYMGELPSPPAKPLAAGSSASTAAPTGAAPARPNSAVVVLRVVIDRDGSVEEVQRASGSVELTPAAISAIRDWKFQPDPGGAIRRQIYVTVNFTISRE